MNKTKIKEDHYREIVMTHLQYIKEKVDANHDHLLRLNGRVSKNEKMISWIIGVGSGLSLVFSSVLGWLGLR